MTSPRGSQHQIENSVANHERRRLNPAAQVYPFRQAAQLVRRSGNERLQPISDAREGHLALFARRKFRADHSFDQVYGYAR